MTTKRQTTTLKPNTPDSIANPDSLLPTAPLGMTSTVSIPTSLLETHTSRARDVLEISQSLAVTTDEEEETAAQFLIDVVAEGIKAVKAALDPICQAAHKTHSIATRTRGDLLRPFEQAELAIKCAMKGYQIEKARVEEEKRKAEDRETRRLAEEAALQEVADLLESGDDATAIALSEQIERGELVSTGIGPPVAKSIVSSAPGMARVETWKCQILKPDLISHAYMLADEDTMTAVAKSIAALVKRMGPGAEKLIGAGSVRIYRDIDVRRTGR